MPADPMRPKATRNPPRRARRLRSDEVAHPLPENAARVPPSELLSLLGRVVRGTDVARKSRVYVNRNLRMDQIDLVGFDMDYTLALYNQQRIEALSVECTLRKLIDRGYPSEILALDYDPSFAIRGLLVDRHYGNVLKMDRYGHVGRVYHGRTRLDKEERHRLYRTQRIRLSSPRYAWIDTLFALPEAVMFARIVELFESQPGRVRYDKLWRDIREAIDEAHRDDSIKRIIKADPGAFIERDPELGSTLHKLRSAGKRLFLLTNSFWDYTDVVMRYLLDGQLSAYPSWRGYFDTIIVGGTKPAFFTERRPFIEIDARSGEELGEARALQRGHVYQGGNLVDFEAHVRCGGERVLYIGDHIYGDMLRAKKASVWRTAMIVQELESELEQAERMSERIRWIERQERRRARLESEIGYQQLVLRSLQRASAEGPTGTPEPNVEAAPNPAPIDAATLAEARHAARKKLDELRATHRELSDEMSRVEAEIDRAFNPWWGQIFKEGTENSRFGEQVEDYACLYTSRVSNFLAYSPLQYFRAPRDHMPHELV